MKKTTAQCTPSRDPSRMFATVRNIVNLEPFRQVSIIKSHKIIRLWTADLPSFWQFNVDPMTNYFLYDHDILTLEASKGCVVVWIGNRALATVLALF